MSAPAKKFNIGSISATIWKNTSGDITWYSVTLQRRYKDDGGEWKNTDQLSAGDLLNTAMLLTRAEAWISQQ